MKRHLSSLILIPIFGLLLITSACRKKAPDGFNADFSIYYNNGGMAPDSVLLAADFPDADNYEWSVEGIPATGMQAAIKLQTAGTYQVELLVESGDHDRSQISTIIINNYPTSGEAMTVVQDDGVIGTFAVDGANPFFVPIDTVATDELTGMDYDDNTKQIYYTGSIKRAFPNGTNKETIFDDNQLITGEKVADLVVDPDDQRVYFAINGIESEAIASVSQDGSDLSFEFQTYNLSPILDITLDAKNNKVYFTNELSTSISKTILGDVSTILFDNSRKYALVFDNTTDYLYFAEETITNNGTFTNILRFQPEFYNSDLPDTWPVVVVENAASGPILGLDISESNQQLYWSNSEESNIYRIDLNDPNAEREIIFRNVANPKAIAIGNFN
ncbi:MAG: hypothetical protein AB8F74_04225 [Saprospiraceae bacterium]